MKYALANSLSSAVSGLDPDAKAYIAAVEAADTQTLEAGVKIAINNFVKGCKSDAIWDAIKASCILAGARTLSGALVPLRGTAPTNFNFVSGDYNRKTGLVGDGSTKYLDSNRNNNADPQNSKSVSLFISSAATISGNAIGAGGGDTGATTINSFTGGSRNNCATLGSMMISGITGLIGTNRNSTSSYISRINSNNSTINNASQTPYNGNLFIFNNNGVVSAFSDNRLSFYHIGESLDLAALDSRVSTLMTAINSAIP